MLGLPSLAMTNSLRTGTFCLLIVNVPIKDGNFPVRELLVYQGVSWICVFRVIQNEDRPQLVDQAMERIKHVFSTEI